MRLRALRLRAARARIDAGLVNEDDFDEERAGWSAAEVWDALQALLPLAPDPVVTHGDYSLDNLFFQDGAVTGWPGQSGQVSPAALSQTVKTKSIFGAPGWANSSHVFERKPSTGYPRLSSVRTA
jgi:hypothetical protein